MGFELPRETAESMLDAFLDHGSFIRTDLRGANAAVDP